MQKLSARTDLRIRLPETRRLSRVNARVSTAKQDLERQVDALLAAGIDPKHIYRDKKSGSTVDRPGLVEVAAVRAKRRRDRGSHLRSAGPHRPRHPEHDPRARRGGSGGQE